MQDCGWAVGQGKYACLTFWRNFEHAGFYFGIFCFPLDIRKKIRSEASLAERERQLREREAEQAEALAALENSRKVLEGAAAFVQACTVAVLPYRCETRK